MNKIKRALIILAITLILLSYAQALSDEEKVRTVAEKAAKKLDWPPPSKSEEAFGTGYVISPDGLGDDSDITGGVSVVGSDIEAQMYLSLFEQWDMQRSSYLGRDAVIQEAGENCNPQGLKKVVVDAISGWLESIFGESDKENCIIEYGTIIWSCGKYIFWANDATKEGGNEDEIAAAIYAAAQEVGLCDYGDTLVIMADTLDRPGTKKIGWAEDMAQRVNQYYGVNSYRIYPPFKFSFRDADGSRGNADWYRIDQPLSNFAGPGGVSRFAVEATKKAFEGADLPEDLYFERIVVLFAGNGKQSDSTAVFSNLCSYRDDNYYVEVNAAQGKRRIYVKNFILLSENRELGGWAHEFGHTLPSKHMMPSGFYRIGDRYNYEGEPDRQYGTSGYWDLMGSGSHWGPDDGSTPTQMASFTKNAAKWLNYVYAAMNGTYDLTALENMQKNGQILIIDDPDSTNPENYFIVEARDSNAVFGAPESGVVIYQVMYDNTYKHHIVNYMSSQAMPRYANSSHSGRYAKPTLYATSGNGSIFLNPVHEFKIKLISQSYSPDTATIKVEEYKPQNIVGAVASPSGGPVINGTNDASTTENDRPDVVMPDIDLHAYDGAGRHTGVNYKTMEYESQIPGAIFSGDLKDAPEWIFLPAGTEATFEVSAYKTLLFLQDNPNATAERPQEYKVKMIKFDETGKRTEADAGGGSIGPGETEKLKKPNDPTLIYRENKKPGFGKNETTCCPLPILLGLLALIAEITIGKAS